MKKISIRESIDVTLPITPNITFQESAKGNEETPKKITTIVEAIHSGLTRNNTFYPSDNLERSVDSWTRPYEKPVIKNHDVHEEPLGRVKRASFKQSNISPDKHTIELELEITDAVTIQKVLDGRYQTLSIGGNTTSAVCSVCGKDLVKEGYCGHQKGRTYEGKQAYWIIGEMDFDEISWVNVPADRSAQVIQKNVVQTTESTPVADEKGGANMPVDKQTADILEQIDHLNGHVQEGDEPASTPAGEPAEGGDPTPEGGDNPEGGEPDAGKPEEGDKPNEDAAALQEELESAKARIVTLETENTTLVAERDELQGQVESLNTDNAELKQQVANLEAELVVANEESAGAVKQNIQLASYTHKVLAENVANLELVLGETTEAEYGAKLAELSKETSRSLKEKAKELSAKKPQRVIQSVANPLHDGADGSIQEFTSSDKKDEITPQEFLNKFAAAFNKTGHQN